MDAHQEIEIKWWLDQDGHAMLDRRLAERLGPARILRQANRFFDTIDGHLRAHRMSLRLRMENERLIVTCKRRVRPASEIYHHHDEWEHEIDPALWSQLPEDAPFAAARFPVPPAAADLVGTTDLAQIGAFTNQRHEFRNDDDLLCLDRTDFGVRIDHELEIETPHPEESHARWALILDGWGVRWNPQPKTKLSRLLEIRASHHAGR
jgi:uncharacterized protein YjbK